MKLKGNDNFSQINAAERTLEFQHPLICYE